MRILIIVDCYYPTTKSSAKLIHDLGVEFHRTGHDVTVLAPSEAIRSDMEISTEEDLRIVRVRTGKIKGASNFFRALQEVPLSGTMWRRSKQFLQQNPCDLIIYYSPSIFFGPLVKRLKQIWGCPSYLILRDIFPRWSVDAGVLRKGIVHDYFRRRELQQYDVADVIAVQTPANFDYFNEELAHKRYRLELLFNWTNLNEEDVPRSNYRKELGLEEKVVFFFGGNIGVAQDMDNIVRLAASLQEHPRIFFLLVGEGSEVERLKLKVRDEEIKNFRILPAVGQKEYLAMLSEFDVGLMSLDRKLKTQNFPGKLLTYMYNSVAILASFNPENDLMKILIEAEAGLCTVNGDDEGLKANALKLAESAELRRRVGMNGRKLLEKEFSSAAAVNRVIEQVKAFQGVKAKAAVGRG
ncbi:MAG: putative glycosyl transferase [Acidobacteriales bacterium]|nr:putative glycosyl transferase [Terriglobales bacterium]